MRSLNKKIWPFQSICATSNNEVREWCDIALGKVCKYWYSYIGEQNRTYYAFKHEEDMVLFKLRWNKNGN